MIKNLEQELQRLDMDRNKIYDSVITLEKELTSIDETSNQVIKTIEDVNRYKNEFLDDLHQELDDKEYEIQALSDNNNMIDIYQLKSENSTLYFRPSGTGPEVRFYIFGKVETHLGEIKRVQKYIQENYV